MSVFKLLRRVLHPREDDATHEIDIRHPQPARLGQPQPGKGAEQDGSAEPFRHHVV
jgi:hypothetical protein